MTMTRKNLFLGIGMAVAFVGVVDAAERNRTAGVANDASVSRHMPELKEVAPGVGVATIGGKQVTIYASGEVRYDELAGSASSFDSYIFDRSRQNQLSGTNSQTGRIAYADGSVGVPADLTVTSAMKAEPTTVEQLKATTKWLEHDVAGVTVILFANGAVLNDPSIQQRMPASALNGQSVPSVVDAKGVTHFADGAVFTQGQ